MLSLSLCFRLLLRAHIGQRALLARAQLRRALALALAAVGGLHPRGGAIELRLALGIGRRDDAQRHRVDNRR